MSVADSGTFQLGGDLPIHRLGYGAMRLTGKGIWGPPADRDEAVRVVRRAVELGVTFIDTAASYGPTVAEEIIFEALNENGSYGDVVVATKGGLLRTGPDVWPPLGNPDFLRQDMELSRRRLGVERIDLWQLHRIDENVPRDEQFGVMKEFVDEGSVRHLGLSEVSVDDIKAAQAFGLNIVSVQNMYNLASRDAEDVLDFCEQNNIAFIPWAPVGSGKLANPGGPLDDVKQKHPGATTSQLALAWLLARSPVMVPIPGTSTVEHLEQNLQAADIDLSADEVQELADAA